MKNFKWSTVFFWTLAPAAAYLFDYFRQEDLVLGVIAFFTLWLFLEALTVFATPDSEVVRSLVGRVALLFAVIFSTVLSTAVQLNYFFHWFTLGGGA